MARGERVGEAYVRIHADGEGMDREIRDMFNDQDGEFNDAGRQHYQKYRDAWAAEGKKNANQTVLRKSITDALARGDYLQNDFFKGTAWKNFRGGLIKRFGDAGRLAGENLERQMVEGMSFDQLRGKLDNITVEIVRAEKQLNAEEKKVQSDREKQQAATLDRLRALFEQYQRDIERLDKGQSIGHRTRADLIRDLERIGPLMHSAGGGTHEFEVELENAQRRIERIHPGLRRYSATVNGIAGVTEKAFGKGSRNNFLNFVGSVVGGSIRLANVVPGIIKGFEQIGNVFSTISGGATNLGFGRIASSLVGISGIALLAAGGLIAVGGAIVTLSFIIGPFISIIGGLLGAVAALASTIGFALVGGLGILATALTPLAGLIGGVALAFTGLSDAAKKGLKLDLKPLLNDFKGLREAVRKPIFSELGRQAKELAPVFRGLRPLFTNLGVAISGLGDYFIHALRSPGFTQFRATMENFLPRAVTLLGQSFGNALGGIGGIFRAAVPQATKFLTWLEKITGEFAKWANSPKGQKELGQFFDKAAESAKALGRFTLDVLKVVGKIADSGKGTGDNIFERMAKAAQDLGDYLDSHPHAVEDFFENADKTATQVGHIVDSLLELIDALDTAQTRIAGNGLLQGLADIASGAANAFNFVRKLGSLDLGNLGNPNVKIPGIDAIGNALEVVKQKYFDFGDWLRGIGRGIGEFFGKLSKIKAPDIPAPSTAKIAGAFTALVPTIGRIMGRVIPLVGGVFSNLAGKVAGAIGNVPSRVGSILGKIPGVARGIANRVGPAFSGVLARVAGFFSGIPGRVQGILGRLPGIARGAAGQAGAAFSGVLGRIRGFFSGVPGAVQGILSRLAGIARGAASGAVSAFSRVQGGVLGHFSGIPGAVGGVLGKLAGLAASAASAVVNAFTGLAGRIIARVGAINFPKPHIPMPDIPHISLPTLTWPVHLNLPHIPGTAVGGMFDSPSFRLIGEAGPEAVVPLNRALSQVDPSVRWLSAIAQGKTPPPGGGASAPSKQYNIDMTVVTPNSDSRAVAAEVIHRLTAGAY